MHFRDAAPPRRRTSLTPLIDVVFLLLVFFMLTSSFIHWRRVDLEAGSEGAPALQAQNDQTWVNVTVSTCSGKGLEIDGKRISVADLGANIPHSPTQKTQALLEVKDGVPLACMVRVLDVLEAAKISSTTVNGLIK